jgi:hypothetical protein
VTEYWESVDPGETVGWANWRGDDLLEAGQTPMWEYVDTLYADAVNYARGLPTKHKVQRLVVEDFRIYPWKAADLAWDSVRTARAIGALELIARVANIPITLQGASIKETAEAAGAEILFLHPLHENRHANDAIRHGVFYLASQTPGFAVTPGSEDGGG